MNVVWGFLKANWNKLGYPLAVLFFCLWQGSGDKLAVCQAALEAERSKPPQVVEAVAKNATTQAVRIVYQKVPGQPQPCPDIEVDANTLAMVEAAMKQPIPAPAPIPAPYWGVELSVGVPVYGLADSSAGGSLLAGSWRLGAEYALISGPRVVAGKRFMFR